MSQSEEAAFRRKRELISQAESIAFNGDLRRGHDEIQALREKWKLAGRAGRDSEGIELDDSLWREFKAACDRFYDRRRRANEDAIAYKRSLIHEVGKLSYSSDTQRVREELKRLRTLWSEAAKPPKRDDDQLWYEFKKEIDHIQGQLNSQYRDNLQGRISRAKEALSNTQSRLYELKIDWQYNQRPEPSPNNPRYYDIMANRRERERKHEERVERLEEKIRDIEASIEAMESKLLRL